MHRLEITGETPEALYFNVVKTLSIFLRGATAPVSPAQETAPSAHEPTVGLSVEPPALGSTTKADGAEVIPPKTRKNAKAAKVEKLDDDIPDLAAGKMTEGAEKFAAAHKPLTLADDIMPRLQAIQKACTERGMAMVECVAFILKLYGPFGIANAKQLKPEQFEEFMEASEAYLTGEA